MNRKWLGLAALLVVVLAGAMIAYNVLAPGVEKSGNTGDTVPAAGADENTDSSPDGSDVSGSAAGAEDANSADGNSEERKPAPDFTVYDADGNKVSLSDFAGEPVVVNFWASWCPPCKAELPDFETLYQEVGIKDGMSGGDATDGAESDAADAQAVRFLMVALTDGQRETQETAASFVEEQGFTFPVYYDLDVDAAYVYGLTSIPVTIFVDADGNMAAYQIGQLDEQTLRTGIDIVRK